ncbi:hypothetical protein HPP92_015423 [Vanilla planifolia]|uniref:Uncharacterized protein n=1 Tax=Vanilla planifolia TaxID=51239 RepID=A0A835QMA2_VANPL|nr:hypothetical protein HPP92_015423 [Vanilla planifolia]
MPADSREGMSRPQGNLAGSRMEIYGEQQRKRRKNEQRRYNLNGGNVIRRLLMPTT